MSSSTERLKYPTIQRELIDIAFRAASTSQPDYIAIISRISEVLRDFLIKKGRIKSLKKNHLNLWDSFKGKGIAYVDGGVGGVEATKGFTPMAIRVASYYVAPGTPNRRFQFENQIVEDISTPGKNSIFAESWNGADDESDDALKMMVRITLESMGLLKCISREKNSGLKMAFLHGSIVNPVSRYTDTHLPDFSYDKIINLLPELGDNSEDLKRRTHFVNVYLSVLNKIQDTAIPVAGVVERKSKTYKLGETLLNQMKESGELNAQICQETISELKRIKVVDSILMHAVLREGEYLDFTEVERDSGIVGDGNLRAYVDRFPKPLVSYLSVSDARLPIRVELMKRNENENEMMNYLYHDSLLMSNYFYPLGLCAVDNFVRVTNSSTGKITELMAMNLLKVAVAKAINDGNNDPIRLVFGHLTGAKRDTFTRPI